MHVVVVKLDCRRRQQCLLAYETVTLVGYVVVLIPYRGTAEVGGLLIDNDVNYCITNACTWQTLKHKKICPGELRRQ